MSGLDLVVLRRLRVLEDADRLLLLEDRQRPILVPGAISHLDELPGFSRSARASSHRPV